MSKKVMNSLRLDNFRVGNLVVLSYNMGSLLPQLL